MRWATVEAACNCESRLPGHRQRADAGADADAHATRCSSECYSGQARQGKADRSSGKVAAVSVFKVRYGRRRRFAGPDCAARQDPGELE